MVSRITGKEYLCRALEAEGVGYIFGNPGTTEIPLLDTLARFPTLRYVLALHESVAVAMADGYARCTGRVAVASVHAAPGSANALGMLLNARRDGTPLLVLAGQLDSTRLLREPMLAADLARLAEQFAKWTYQVAGAGELPLALSRAFRVASQPPAGPVFLSLPRDFLEETIEAGAHLRASPPLRLRGEGEAIERAATLLLGAQAPVALVGPGVRRARAWQEMTELAETAALRVFATPGSFPTRHPLFCGYWRPTFYELEPAVASADLLLVVGSPMFRELPLWDPALIAADLPIIHLDPDPWEVGKNYPSAVGIVADVGSGLRELTERVKALLDDQRSAALATRRRANQAYSQERRAAREAAQQACWDRSPISAARLAGELDRVLGEEALIVEEATRSGTYLQAFFPWSHPGGYMASSGGCLGWGLGAALGAKLALPQRPVVAFLGDGSTAYSLQGLWTAARYQIPLLVIVCNNRAYVAMKSSLFLYGGRIAERGEYGCVELEGLDFVQLARGFGVEGRRVAKPDELRPALEWGLALGRPALLEVMLDPREAGFGLPSIPA
jgi:benzoylformate decarboxylase